MRASGTSPKRIAYRSPWQNGAAERWVGTIRRELLDHVIVLGENHSHRLSREFVAYYHADRCHLGLEKDPPADERSGSVHPVPRRSSFSPASADCIIATSGARPHSYSARDRT